MKVTYDSNNSGGGWWLKDKDWEKLEKAGWTVNWGGTYFCHSKYGSIANVRKPTYESFRECATAEECHGHRALETYEEASKLPKDRRWLGCIARGATIECQSLGEAIRIWENATGMDASDNGCNCCGPPHSFSGDNECVSGEEIAEVLTGIKGLSYREALEKLRDR